MHHANMLNLVWISGGCREVACRLLPETDRAFWQLQGPKPGLQTQETHHQVMAETDCRIAGLPAVRQMTYCPLHRLIGSIESRTGKCLLRLLRLLCLNDKSPVTSSLVKAATPHAGDDCFWLLAKVEILDNLSLSMPFWSWNSGKWWVDFLKTPPVRFIPRSQSSESNMELIFPPRFQRPNWWYTCPFEWKPRGFSTGSGEEELRSPAAAEAKGSRTWDGPDAGATGYRWNGFWYGSNLYRTV